MVTDQWLHDYESKLAELEQKSEELQEGIAAAESTVASADGSVTVTVGPNGGLRDLRLGHRAVDLGAARLTALILETTRTAQRQAVAKVRAAFEPLGAGTEAMDLYADAVPDEFVAPEEPEPTPPPAPPKEQTDEDDGRPW